MELHWSSHKVVIDCRILFISTFLMDKLFEAFKANYQSKEISYEEFQHILRQFAKLDIRCELDDNVMLQVYDHLKQQRKVTFDTVETIIFDFLLQQPYQEPQLEMPKIIGSYAEKLPDNMRENITPEFFQQFINFYKLVYNKLGPNPSFRDIERLGQEIQRQTRLDHIELTRYMQPFQDEQHKVNMQDVLGLINDMERMQAVAARQSVTPTTQAVEHGRDEHNSSSDEEQLPQTDFANLLQQKIDTLIKQKCVKSDGIKLVNEVAKCAQALESKLRQQRLEAEEANKKVYEATRKAQELEIEKELLSGAINRLEQDFRSKEQQMLIDLDFFQAQSQILEDQNGKLLESLEQSNKQIKDGAKLEWEIRQKESEVARLHEDQQKQRRELERLQENNRALMKIIKDLESKEEESKPAEVLTQKIIEVDDSQLNELANQIDELKTELATVSRKRDQYELEIIELRREVVHYRQLYENMNREVIQLRTSIMPRQSSRPTLLGCSSTLRLPGASQQDKGTFIGRGFPTLLSSIRPGNNSIIPRGSLYPSGQHRIKIEEADDNFEKDQNLNPPDQISFGDRLNMRPQQRFGPSGILSESIKESELEGQEDQPKQKEVNTLTLVDALKVFMIDPEAKKEREKDRFLNFDEEIFYAKDYLGIREDKKIQDILALERKTYNVIVQKCFSDSIYRIDHKGRKARRIIFVTEYNFYIFEGESRPQKITRHFPIHLIHTIVFSESSPVLCMLQITSSDDYLLESFRRSDLNSYLTEIFSKQKRKLYQLDFRLTFKVKFKGQKEPIQIDQIQKRQGYLDHGKMSAYKVSSSKGWLQLYTKKVFLKNWQEVFALLTNVGLVIFKKPGEIEPLLFISLVDALVIKNPITEHNKPHILKIRYEVSEIEYLFSVTSAALLDEWHDMIQHVIMEQVKLQGKQLEAQQQKILEQRTQNLHEQFEND